MNHEHVFKVPEHAFPDSFPPSFCSQSTCPLWEPGFITPILLPTSAEASQSSACSGVPRCHRASFCLLKGMLAEGRVAESCFRAAVKCSGWYWGEKEEHGAEPPAHCCLQSWITILQGPNFTHESALPPAATFLPSVPAPAPWLSRWEPGPFPECCLATLCPDF